MELAYWIQTNRWGTGCSFQFVRELYATPLLTRLSVFVADAIFGGVSLKTDLVMQNALLFINRDLTTHSIIVFCMQTP